MAKFTPNPNITRGATQASGSSHQFTGSVDITGSLTLNGAAVTTGGGGGGGISWDGSTANGVATFKDADEATVESNLTFDGSTLTVTGAVSASSYISASAFHGDLYRDPATAGQVLFTDTGGITNSDAGLMYAPGSDTLYIPNITTLGSVDFTINTTAGQDAKLYLGDDDGNKALFFYNNSGGQVALIDAAGRISGSQIYGDGSNLTNLQAAGSATDSVKIGNNNGAVAVGSLNISFGGTVLGQGSQAIGPGSPRAVAAGASAVGSGSQSTATNALAVGTTSIATAAAAVALGSSATGSAANAIAVGTTTKATAAGATALGNAATSSAAGAIAIGSGATTAGAYSVVLGDTITNVIHNHTTVIGSRAAVGGANAVAIGSGSNASAANAIAIGEAAAPTAADTIAIGQAAISSATGSITIGADSTTSGQQSVVLGPTNKSSAHYTTVVGYNNNASVNYSIIIGDTSVASAANAVAVGQKVKASGADSIAIGQFATASAANTIAIGSGSQAIEANTVVFGNSTQPVRLFISGAAASTYFSASIDTSIQATCSFYNIFNYGLTANSVITASNPIAGASYLFFLRQPSAGSKTALFSGFKWAGGSAPTLSTGANAVDIVSGVSDGEFIYADITKAFS
jgi:hypothetical protein